VPVVAAARDLRILTEVSRGIVPIETRAAGVVMRSDDGREGPLAFMEKRKPTFAVR
jgi:1,4-dihydroxy-2-naphthoyl-CoA synthase